MAFCANEELQNSTQSFQKIKLCKDRRDTKGGAGGHGVELGTVNNKDVRYGLVPVHRVCSICPGERANRRSSHSVLNIPISRGQQQVVSPKCVPIRENTTRRVSQIEHAVGKRHVKHVFKDFGARRSSTPNESSVHHIEGAILDEMVIAEPVRATKMDSFPDVENSIKSRRRSEAPVGGHPQMAELRSCTLDSPEAPTPGRGANPEFPIQERCTRVGMEHSHQRPPKHRVIELHPEQEDIRPRDGNGYDNTRGDKRPKTHATGFDCSQHQEKRAKCSNREWSARRGVTEDFKAQGYGQGHSTITPDVPKARAVGVRNGNAPIDRAIVKRQRFKTGLNLPPWPLEVSDHIWVNEMTSGDDPRLVFRTSKGRISPHMTSVQRDLDRVSPGSIDTRALRYLFPRDPRLKILDFIEDYDVFKNAFQNRLLPRGIRRATSRHMLRFWEILVEDAMVEPIHNDDMEVAMNLFTVDKKNGRLRLIMDCRKINNLMQRPPVMPIPKIHDVIKDVVGANYFCSVDAKGYFYQFLIADPRIRRFFGVRLAAQRGLFKTGLFRKMPMGWSYAPSIAQTVSNVLISGIPGAHVWVDNFIFTGSTVDELEHRFGVFQERAKTVNLLLDEYTARPVQQGVLLGIEFDSSQHRFRMSPDWEAKIYSRSVQWAASSSTSPLQVFEILGSLIWAGYVRCEPLCLRADAIDVARDAARFAGAHGWDAALQLNPMGIKSLQDWIASARINNWVPASIFHKDPATIQIWTDASDAAWAYLDESMTLTDQGSFGPQSMRDWHIFIKEAWAVHMALTAAHLQGHRSVALHIDNQALLFALRRRYSSVNLVNHWLCDHVHLTLTVDYVPSAENPADPYTRGLLFTGSAPKVTEQQQL